MQGRSILSIVDPHAATSLTLAAASSTRATSNAAQTHTLATALAGTGLNHPRTQTHTPTRAQTRAQTAAGAAKANAGSIGDSGTMSRTSSRTGKESGTGSAVRRVLRLLRGMLKDARDFAAYFQGGLPRESAAGAAGSRYTLAVAGPELLTPRDVMAHLIVARCARLFACVYVCTLVRMLVCM